MSTGIGPEDPAQAVQPVGVRLRLRRSAEMIAVFFALPIALVPLAGKAPRLLLLAIAALACGITLWRDGSFNRRSPGRTRWHWHTLLKRLSLRATVSVMALTAIQCAIDPAEVWSPPRREPFEWLGFALVYPFVSACPQEVIYRAYFFHRYACLFHRPGPLVWASAAAFAALHLVYQNPAAPLLSLAAGYWFGTTYARTRSLAAAAVEHALIGNIVFAVGLGAYFGASPAAAAP
jgi:membrane protease YdiL (CAAX protease family)